MRGGKSSVRGISIIIEIIIEMSIEIIIIIIIKSISNLVWNHGGGEVGSRVHAR